MLDASGAHSIFSCLCACTVWICTHSHDKNSWHDSYFGVQVALATYFYRFRGSDHKISQGLGPETHTFRVGDSAYGSRCTRRSLKECHSMCLKIAPTDKRLCLRTDLFQFSTSPICKARVGKSGGSNQADSCAQGTNFLRAEGSPRNSRPGTLGRTDSHHADWPCGSRRTFCPGPALRSGGAALASVRVQ